MNVDADLVTAIAALAAVPLSAVATLIAMRADARSKVAARTQVYLALRARFFEVHSQLPPGYADPDWRPELKSERAAATRYWHHAFDEWYATTQLDPALLRGLWRQYFSGAVISGLRHNGLRAHLFESIALRGEHDQLWMSFVREMERLWARSHPDAAGVCGGLTCNHTEKGLLVHNPTPASTTGHSGSVGAKPIGRREGKETYSEQVKRDAVDFYLRRCEREGVKLSSVNTQVAPVHIAGGADDAAVAKPQIYFVSLPDGFSVLPVDWRRFAYDHAKVRELLGQCVWDNIQLFRFEPWSDELRERLERTLTVALADLCSVFDVKSVYCERNEDGRLRIRIQGEHKNGEMTNHVIEVGDLADA